MTRAALPTPIDVAAVSLLWHLTQSASADGACVLWFAQGTLSRHGVLMVALQGWPIGAKGQDILTGAKPVHIGERVGIPGAIRRSHGRRSSKEDPAPRSRVR